MMPEEEARVNIDKLLNLSGWVVQDYKKINLSPTLRLGIAVLGAKPIPYITSLRFVYENVGVETLFKDRLESTYLAVA